MGEVVIIEILSSTQFQIMVYKYMKVTGGGEEEEASKQGFRNWLTDFPYIRVHRDGSQLKSSETWQTWNFTGSQRLSDFHNFLAGNQLYEL